MPALTVEILNPKARSILDGLEDAGLIAITGEPNRKSDRRSILELKGLGAEIWKDESVEEYIRKERESWESSTR